MTEQARKLQKFIPPGINAVVRVAFYRFDGDTLTGRLSGQPYVSQVI